MLEVHKKLPKWHIIIVFGIDYDTCRDQRRIVQAMLEREYEDNRDFNTPAFLLLRVTHT